MLQGLRTTIYMVDDIQIAKEWYSTILNIQPYFDQPFYVGFNVGGYELGLHPIDENKTDYNRSDNVLSYWGVDDIHTFFNTLLQKGIKIHEQLHDVGEGILIASFYDPFGNIIGIIKNPFFNIESIKL